MAVQAIAAGLGAIQAGYGAYQTIAGNRRLERLMNQRELYKMPDETVDAFNLAVNNAQTGYDASTMKYLTSQTDRALSGSLDAITRLDGDPNDVMGIFDASMQNIMKIGADNQQIQMQELNAVFQGLAGIKEGKDAEYASREALLKDKMAMEAQKVQAGMQNLQSGLNLGLSAFGNMEAEKLYKTEMQKLRNTLTTTTAPQKTTAGQIGDGNFNMKVPDGYFAPPLPKLPSSAPLNTALNIFNR